MLRRKEKSRRVKETLGKYSIGKSIRKRDKSVYRREVAGLLREFYQKEEISPTTLKRNLALINARFRRDSFFLPLDYTVL